MMVRILDAGLYTLVVDQGRPHCRHLGVSVGGAADRTSLALGNSLVGNPPDAAAVEFSLKGPTIVADCDLACVVYGAPFDVRTEKRFLRVGRTFTLTAGEELYIGGTAEGMRGYFCIKGGILGRDILESRSSLAPLPSGVEFPCRPGRIGIRSGPPELDWTKPSAELRVIDGPQADWLQAPLFANSQSPAFLIKKDSNRMGLRLEGPALAMPNHEMVSEPVAPGAVQVTRDGQCIVLGVDGQTIGGYPKVAQVISADLDILGQLRPADEIRFVRVSLREARTIHQEKNARLAEWITRLRTTLEGA